jgi:hypothetical protein
MAGGGPARLEDRLNYPHSFGKLMTPGYCPPTLADIKTKPVVNG